MKTMKSKRSRTRKTKALFTLSFLSIVLGLALFVCGILLAFFDDQSTFYLLAFGGLPFLWLGSFLWRTARHVPLDEDLPPVSGSVTCGMVDVSNNDTKNNEK